MSKLRDGSVLTLFRTKRGLWLLWLLSVVLMALFWSQFTGMSQLQLRLFYASYLGVLLLSFAAWATPWASFLSAQLLILVITLADHYKHGVLDSALQVQDLYYLFRDICGNISLLYRYYAVTLVVCVVCLLYFACCYLVRRLERRHAFLQGWPVRGYWHVLCASLAICLTWLLWSETFSPSSDRIANNQSLYHRNSWFWLRTNRSSLTGFIASIFRLQVHVPADPVGAKRFESFLAQQPSGEPLRQGQGQKPDIMVVLQESHACVSKLLDDFHARSLSPDRFTVWKGVTRVHTFGGGSFLSEFGFLTGLYWGDFGVNGCYAPYTLSGHIPGALPRTLAGLGYRTVAFSTLDGNFFDTKRAYENYGFEEFVDGRQLLGDYSWTIKDKDLYSAVLERLKRDADARPLFVFVLTIRNHAPHWAAVGKEQERTDLPKFPNEGTRNAFHNYFNNYDDSIDAMAFLRDAWLSGSDKPRLLAFFGDHWPSFEGHVEYYRTYQKKALAEVDYYLTPACILSNFARNLDAPPEMDLAYFASSILEAGDVVTNDYWRIHQVMMRRLQGHFVDSENPAFIEDFLSYSNLRLHALN